jgi:hypothetical protein
MSSRKETPDVLAEILGGDLVAPVERLPVKAERRPAVRTTERTAPKSSPPKPKGWEYIIVSFQDHSGWRPRFINGQEQKNWISGPLIHEYLETMGAEGWEVTAASAGERMYGSQDKRQIYFRRPK